ncbi:hypothetical protein IAQ61_004863 [Plenodomus lingam]|uniref:Uncharacterized protein n=1 Tax=Leptosphaeria maculans (strain JN3 / isolate v23.1.3 / race Av1-4-5-6-7-8) TaxID=985895 RepID=E4ZWR2_LEPMJ|nr:hypothetical protein LEMA_P031900.1 [Plenodomus lingam JN3]KAH9874233.1 hypothetical protein IAQ61_004863 [Plenodomus lingam]CBX96038.1 hypothetical protein LEMA_P031900.1 [Plenodomus lingam JN3]
MGNSQHLQHTRSTSSASSTIPVRASTYSWPLFAINGLLSTLSIINLGLISSTIAWLLEQRHGVHSFQIGWSGRSTPLNVEPKNLWVAHNYESIAAAGYGLLVGIFGMITAWRMRKASRRLKSLDALAVFQLVAILFTLSVLIFVFIVTHGTNGQQIREPVASNNIGVDYFEFTWTPETWMTAILQLPLVDGSQRKEISSKVTNMVAWRWMLVAILMVDYVALTVTLIAWLKQRRSVTSRTSSADWIEK